MTDVSLLVVTSHAGDELEKLDEARDVSLPAVLEMLAEAREEAQERLGDVVADDEALRVATRAVLVKDQRLTG